MREFEVTYKNKRLKATKSNEGNYCVILPSKEGSYTRIINCPDGWLYSTMDLGSEYFFELWLRQDGKLGWRNDLDNRDHISSEKYDPVFENAGTLNDVARELYSVVRQFYGYQKFGISPISIVDLKKDLAQIKRALSGNTGFAKQIAQKIDEFAPFIEDSKKSDGTEGVKFSIPEDFSKAEFLRDYQRMLTVRKRFRRLIDIDKEAERSEIIQ